MKTPSSGGSSSRRSGHRRIADFLAEDQDSGDELFSPATGGGMLPIFLNDQSELVEVMLELDEESMVVRSVTPTYGGAAAVADQDPAVSLSRSSSTASRIRRKFAWLKSPSPRRSPSPSPLPAKESAVAALAARDARRRQARLDRTRSGAQRALKGLRFISRTTGSVGAAELWRRVEERFASLAKDGLLSRDDFGECIGMVDSKEFAVGLFDALARRRRQTLERITKEELYDFWVQISDQSFDARLQIFFDIVDTNVDGRITRKEVQELIVLSASANKLSKLKEQAEEYAALIMEELDPENLGYIEMIATAIVIGMLLHAGNHLACDFPRVIGASPEKYRLVARDFGPVKPTYSGLLTGVEGVTGIGMVVLMAVSFTLATHRFRKNGGRLPFPLNRLTGFNAFWYSHHLLAVAYGLLVVHGYYMFLVHKWYQRTTWMYLSVPLLLYVGERVLRAFRSKAYSVKILKVSLLPGSVLTLTMSKPHGFRYRSGQYIFLQCPTISPFEWHPFSITSAPGDDYLSVHIRTSGDWTQELKRIFLENYFSPRSIGRATFNELGSVDQRSLPRLLVDGPYGAPAQDFRNYDVLLLVGLGIGATPFISILRDLLNNIKLAEELMDLAMETSRSEDSSNSFSFSTSSSSKKRPYRTTRAYFYWVTREPGSFEWFKGVMNDVAEMDKKGVIELHNYLTSVYEEGDARTTLLTMVQALNHAKHGVDIVSGTRVRTHFARPNWKEVFAKIASKHPGATVGVFYCGTPILAKELKRLSHELSQKTTTRFHFHKEYF
uniref:Respiratory burst oxidase homolog protein E isoform X3 n=1 Tax=Elaeis guineensis var. tenera TaxID=51953 RepID=A0A6I9R078_ELAGV|nr:respiratory burst oxidase homolog protein E isoform X3 [Elaeis guineensis]